jgi:hypothetical protein
MAAGVIQAIEPVDSDTYEHGTVPAKEKASVTAKAGGLAVLNGGYVEEAGTAPSTVKYILVDNGHNSSTDGTDTQVWPVTTDALWEGTLKTAWAQALVGGNVGLVKDSTTGHWYLDDADTADQVTIEAVVYTPQLGAIGDTYTRVRFRFQTANIAGA